MWSWFFYGLNCFWWEARHNSIVSHMRCFPLSTICSEVVLTFGFQYFDYDLVGMLFLLMLCGGQLSSCTCGLIHFIHIRWPMATATQTVAYSPSPFPLHLGLNYTHFISLIWRELYVYASMWTHTPCECRVQSRTSGSLLLPALLTILRGSVHFSHHFSLCF